jgi:hypothetical protein
MLARARPVCESQEFWNAMKTCPDTNKSVALGRLEVRSRYARIRKGSGTDANASGAMQGEDSLNFPRLLSPTSEQDIDVYCDRSTRSSLAL